MLKEFKEFIKSGNVLSVAIGFVMGVAFKAIIDSVVNDLIMPIVSLLTGGVDFSNFFFTLNGESYPTLQAAKDAGAAAFAYGNFIQAVVTFLIIAFVLFLIVKSANRFSKKEEAAPVTTKICPFCKSEIALDATRCPNCTSELK